jgi:hypothetical protein
MLYCSCNLSRTPRQFERQLGVGRIDIPGLRGIRAQVVQLRRIADNGISVVILRPEFALVHMDLPVARTIRTQILAEVIAVISVRRPGISFEKRHQISAVD